MRHFYIPGLIFIIINIIVFMPLILIQLDHMEHEVYQRKLEYEIEHEV